ncbi:MAG: endonuclease domain-containing protein [Leucobacter sp.]
MSVEHELQQRGGVALTTTLHRCGYTRHSLRVAIAAKRIAHVRKGWVSLPDADPQLIFAVRHAVVLTCVTQAARLGLWVLAHDRPHVAGSLTARKTTAPNSVVHWQKPLTLRKPGALTDSIENMLDCVSTCQPHVAALAIWDSALQKKLIDYPALASLRLRPAARTLLSECTPFADSGLETIFRTNLRWTGVSMRTQVSIHGHRVDLLIGERLIVQLDGKQHSGAQRVSDMEHDAALAQRGYTVFRFGYAQVVHGWPKVETEMLGAIARNLHLARR